MLEHHFTCPHCWQNISMLLDTAVTSQTYIEDCEVCCNPIQISVKFSYSEIMDFQANSIDQ
ncbi:CPXCG motif-containing cysteine-rich protein [Changchengzhania lutea]|uniref:CPXCG motif-containing cysteine-rich protein n=1 Tax=Changchengzhania lutea TaxID=2049305 RepID=UPI00115DCF80|nr:CPXCG motif-containing cysteine-rich protein [Changchengzhania lutea]